jgi:hypothetical protein
MNVLCYDENDLRGVERTDGLEFPVGRMHGLDLLTTDL